MNLAPLPTRDRWQGDGPAGRVRPVFENALLLGAVAALALPKVGTGLALLFIVALWIAIKPPRQELFFVAGALGLVTIMIFGSLLASRVPAPDTEKWSAEIANGFEAVWQDLRGTARQAAANFEQTPSLGGDHRAEFDRLEALIASDRSDVATTFLLLTPGGETVAWAGDGCVTRSHRPTVRSWVSPFGGGIPRRQSLLSSPCPGPAE